MGDYHGHVDNEAGPIEARSQLGDLRPEVAELLSDRLSDIETSLQEVGAKYAETMLTAQVMEFAMKLAAAALNADPSDDEQPAATAENWLNAKPAHAIEELRQRLNDGPGDTQAIVLLLEQARYKRNELAHDFWWRALPMLLSGEPDALVEELEESTSLFNSVLADLKDRIMASALSLRSVSEDSFIDFVSLLTLFLLREGSQKKDLNLKTDGHALVTEVAAWLGTELGDDTFGSGPLHGSREGNS